MTRKVVLIPSTASVKKAAETMKTLDIGALPVRDRDSVVGIVTDRDITIRSTAAGNKPAKTPVHKIMTPRLIYCFDDDSLDTACELMGKERVRRLVVLDHQENIVGVVGLTDVMLRAGESEVAGETLEAVCGRKDGTRRRLPDYLETLRSIAERNLEREGRGSAA
jgi:predicted transcriptional regulator